MKIGIARFDLTPKEGSEFYLLGYKNPNRNQPAKGIHDHIFSNSILFDIDGNRVFLWTADLLELPDSTANEIRMKLEQKFGINRNQIILGVMHDHSSIRDFHIDWPFGKFSQDYYDFFIDSILSSFKMCESNLKEAHAKYGKEIIKGYYSNRNHEGQLADNEVIVVKFLDENQVPFAGIVNWAVHSTAMGAGNMYLTGDLAGNTCRKLKDKWGFYPVFLNGAGADSSNRNDRQGKDFDELERQTTGLCEQISQIEMKEDLILDSIQYRVLSHKIVTDMEVYHSQLKSIINQLENGSLALSGDMPVSSLIDKCKEQLKLKEYQDEIEFEVLDIGQLRFFVFPGELESIFGKKLKESTNKCALIAGYSNGFHYYFLSENEYGHSFETIGNPVPKGEPEKIIEKMMEAGFQLDNCFQK
ncbi:MAG: neutral/alkaline non-lysosomal ceramidase N-terminal domain-containing protein [Floccifex sp.]